MKSYDVVAYANTNNGCVICAHCITYKEENSEEDFSPIFAGDEFDVYPICDRCHTVIDDVVLTDYGDVDDE